MIPRPNSQIATVWFFGATLFASAYLTFQVEPLVAKMMLPLLGGAPMVWNTCLVFFQITLLAGYAYAHGVTTLFGSRRSTVVHAAVLIAALLALPISVPTPPDPGANPTVWMIQALVRTVGLPFFALTASSSLVQAWFASTDHPRAHDPYFLYAASNLGSLLGLLLYPIVIEPSLSLANQSRFWSVAYLVFAILAAGCAATTIRTSRTGAHAPPTPSPGAQVAVGWPSRIRWLLLSLIPSSLLLGTTSYLTTDIASVPLLWVAPLSIYLITFILAFGVSSDGLADLARDTLPLLVAASVVFMTRYAAASIVVAIGLHLALLATASLMCHAYLARMRPPSSHLTEFYLWIAAGGVVGGLFNVVVAPTLFESVVEYPLMLVAACAAAALAPKAGKQLGLVWRDGLWPVVIFGITVATTGAARKLDPSGAVIIVALAVPAVISFSQSQRVVRFALCMGAILLAATATNTAYGRVLYQERTFFGVYRVSENNALGIRSIYSGTTLHGAQSLVAGREMEPLFYYAQTGPVGQLFAHLPQLNDGMRVGVIGLGVGALSTYATPHQRWTYYEIDPVVERLARTERYFTFLSACGHRCKVILGDARLSLRNAEPSQYTLLFLDAFSSDAIPMHLLTREAVSLYVSHLAPGGVLVFHISNRHLSLAPVLARVASELGLAVLRQVHVTPDASTHGQAGYEWLALAPDSHTIAPLSAAGWRAPDLRPNTPLWTDDFSNIVSVLR